MILILKKLFQATVSLQAPDDCLSLCPHKIIFGKKYIFSKMFLPSNYQVPGNIQVTKAMALNSK